jgi:endonuclease/exonuclease/phosphatase family metal-dependent hydrolase
MPRMRIQTIVATLTLWGIVFVGGCSDSNNSSGGNSTASTTPPVTLANLNVLHGFNCDPPLPADGDQCRVGNRIELLTAHLIDRGCPDLVTLQEIVDKEYVQRSPTERAGPLDSIVELIEEQLPILEAGCGFRYQIVYPPFLPATVAETDEELILSRYPVVHMDTHILHSAMYDEPNGLLIFARHLLYVRIAHPSGEVDVYTTHMSSGSDSATNNCNSFRELIPGTGVGPRVTCPIECDSSDTVRACQAEQIAMYVEQTRGADNLALITGDFNAVPGTSEYLSMTNRGWVDSHIFAKSPECDSATGLGCTGGRSSRIEDIENPALNVDRRIDYIFVVLPKNGNSCVASEGSQPLGAYQITDAGLFAGAPNPFTEVCGSAPSPVCWVSDHSGNHAEIHCTP